VEEGEIWRRGAAMGKVARSGVERVQPIGLRISSLVGSVVAGRRTHEPIPFCSTVQRRLRQGSLSNETSEMSLDYGLLGHFLLLRWDSLSVRCFITAIRPLGAAGSRG